MLVGAYEALAKDPADGRRRVGEARDRVVALYRAWGRPEQIGRFAAQERVFQHH